MNYLKMIDRFLKEGRSHEWIIECFEENGWPTEELKQYLNDKERSNTSA